MPDEIEKDELGTPQGYFILRRVKGYTRKDGIHVRTHTRRVWVVSFPYALRYLDLSYFGREDIPSEVRTPVSPRPSVKKRKARRTQLSVPGSAAPKRRARRKTVVGGRGAPPKREIADIGPIFGGPTPLPEPPYEAGREEPAPEAFEEEEPERPSKISEVPETHDVYEPVLKEVEPPKAEGKRDPIHPADWTTDGEWFPMAEFFSRLEELYGIVEVQDPIYRQDTQGEFIYAPTGLVWERELPELTMREIGGYLIGVVRIWALCYNTNKDEYFIFARAISIRLSTPAKSFEEAYEVAQELYDDLIEETSKWEYIEVRQLLAWTFWYNAEKAKGGRQA